MKNAYWCPYGCGKSVKYLYPVYICNYCNRKYNVYEIKGDNKMKKKINILYNICDNEKESAQNMSITEFICLILEKIYTTKRIILHEEYEYIKNFYVEHILNK